MRKISIICGAILTLQFFIWCVVKSWAMPPYPDLEKLMRAGKVATPEHLTNPRLAQEMGFDQPVVHPISAVYPQGTGAIGSYKALVLLVNFTDNPSVVNPSFFDTLIFADQPHCVRNYFQEVTYGTFDIVTLDLPSSTTWYTAPHTYDYYVDGQYGLYGLYPHNSQKLVEDLVDLVDPVVDFSEYDNDGDDYVDALIVVHAGQGAEYTGDTADIWSHSWGVTWFWSSSNLKDGVRIGSYTIQPEYWLSAYDMTCGVYCHELGHNFGLPDLYDYGYDSYGIGKWSLMAVGCWNGTLGNTPAHPDAYCMDRLGYLSPIVVTANTSGVKIPDIENSPEAYKLWMSGLPLSQYFLVSNRQRVGYDSALPYSGLLIWHIDESIFDEGANDHQWYPGYTGYGHYKVALEQADGLWQLEKMSSYGNSGDPFPGSGGKKDFSGITTPNSNDYSGAETYVAVINISNSQDTMTCDLLVSPADVDDENEPSLPAEYQLKQNYPNPFNPQTEIEYYLSKSGLVSLKIFNALGEKVCTLVSQQQERGSHPVNWNGTDDRGTPVSNGIYFCQLQVNNFIQTNKMILLK